MRALQRCDFCGDEAVGTFEIVPHELEPTDAEQRRVLLCPDCETRLEGLLEPLLDRLGVEEPTTGDRVGSSAGRTDAASERENDTTGGRTGDSLRTDDSDDGGTADDTTDSDDGGTGDATDPAVKTTDSVGETDDAEADEPGSDGSTDPETDGDGDTDLDDDGDSETVAFDESPDPSDESDGPANESTGPDADEHGDDEGGNAAADPRPPSGYNRVMRLLRNRELPMDRTDAESLVAGAYDLEGHEVDAIIEFAVRTGELEEDGEQLVRP